MLSNVFVLVHPKKLFPSCLLLFSGSVLFDTSFSMLHAIMKSQNAILLVAEVSAELRPAPFTELLLLYHSYWVGNNHVMRSRICITMHVSENVKSRIIHRKE